MGNKNKTVSFRVNEETFEALRDIAEDRDLSLSTVFREYVDTFVAHEGQVRVISEDGLDDPDADFPPKVQVSTEYIREHERLELEVERMDLENKHLREKLEEHRKYISSLQEQLTERDAEDVIYLEDLDDQIQQGEETYRIG